MMGETTNPCSTLSDEELRKAFIEKVHSFCAFASNHTPPKRMFERHFTSIMVMAEELAKREVTDRPINEHMLPTALLREIGVAIDYDGPRNFRHNEYDMLVSTLDSIGYTQKIGGYIEVTEAVNELLQLMKTPLFEKAITNHFRPENRARAVG